MKKSRKDWEAREPEFSREDFERDERWFIGVIVGLVLVSAISVFILVVNI